MHRLLRSACVIAWPLLICGCQSSSPPRAVVLECQPPPTPAAWFMEAREPNLPQRLRNELSPSLATATRD